MKKNLYPGVGKKPTIDRHGKPRWRLRKTVRGVKIDTYLPGPYGSEAFKVAYHSAIDGTGKVSALEKCKEGTFDHLIIDFKTNWLMLDNRPGTKKGKSLRLERIRKRIGPIFYRDLKPKHVQMLMQERNGPNSANRLLKELKEIYNHAQHSLGYVGQNPTNGIKSYKVQSTGHHSWTETEVRQFREKFASGTRERLAFEIMVGTGAARQDAAAIGSNNVFESKDINYRRIKTGQDTTIPLRLVPALAKELSLLDGHHETFLKTQAGKAFTSEGFGNFFAKSCKVAELPDHCRAHGLRKYGATRLAEAGASEAQIMAFLAHRTESEAIKYREAARRKKLVSSGLTLANAAEDVQPEP